MFSLEEIKGYFVDTRIKYKSGRVVCANWITEKGYEERWLGITSKRFKVYSGVNLT